MAYSVNSKGRTLMRGKSIACYVKITSQLLSCRMLRKTFSCSIVGEQQTELAHSARRKKCDHVRSPFGFDKQSHVTKIVDVWRHSQLSRLSLNSRSTCFGSNSQIAVFWEDDTKMTIVFGMGQSTNYIAWKPEALQSTINTLFLVEGIQRRASRFIVCKGSDLSYRDRLIS